MKGYNDNNGCSKLAEIVAEADECSVLVTHLIERKNCVKTLALMYIDKMSDFEAAGNLALYCNRS